MSFISELKRRNVFKVGVAYLALGWVMIQVTAMAVPALNLPETLNSIVFYLGLIGFPFALFFAWAFELTPDGVKPTSEIDPNESIAATTGQKLNYALVPLLLIALFYMLYERQATPVVEPVDISAIETTQSIAVLPFADMSPDSDQEYFSDGISEEILNVLVKIPELKVAGRTSSFAFKGQNKDLRDIGAELNVNHILEGSVRRSGSKLRITAQLIRSDDGFHVWSETYDREMTDIFDIQDDISKSIAKALAISLGIGEGATLVTNRTEVPAAYEAYLRARQAYSARGLGLKDAVVYLNEVLVYDPKFVPAWALLAKTYSVYPYFMVAYTTENWSRYLSLAKRAAERALALDANSAEALVALANVYKEQRGYVKAHGLYNKAIILAPRDPDARQQYAELLLILDNDRALALEQAQLADELDPNVPILMNVHAWALSNLGRNEEPITLLRKVQKIDSKMTYISENLIVYLVLAKRYDEALHEYEARVKDGLSRSALGLDELKALLENPIILADPTMAARYIMSTDNATPLGKVMKGDFVEAVEMAYLGDPYGQIGFFPFVPNVVWANPHFRDQVKRMGIFKAWKVLGFPTYCKSVGDDDFECKKDEQ